MAGGRMGGLQADGGTATRRGRWAIIRIIGIVTALVAASSMISARAALVPTPDSVSSENLQLLANVELTHPDSADQNGEAPGDIAFWGDYAAVGRGIQTHDDRRLNGFVLFDISDPAQPVQVSRFDCVNTGWDISMWEDLVILSQEEPSATDECDSLPAGAPTDVGAFAGLRIVSIADPANPVPVAAVPTPICETDAPCTGSHTHTVYPDLANDRLVVYSNSLPMTVAVIPLDDPAAAHYVADVSTLGGGLGGTNGCHDLQILASQRIAACSSINEVSLWDITDPLAPVVFSHFSDPTMFHHHSTVFSPDGRTLVLQDESFYSLAGEVSPLDDGCIGTDAGALRFWDIGQVVDDYRSGAALISTPQPLATLQVPTSVANDVEAWCYAHYGNVVPIPPDPKLAVRNVLVIGWAGAGTWMVDFTDPRDPRFVGHHYDTGSDTTSQTFTGSSYFYRGRVYANNGTLNVYGRDRRDTDRGFEVFRPSFPSTTYGKQLKAAFARADAVDYLNPQTQACIGPCPEIASAPRADVFVSAPGVAMPAGSQADPALWCTIKASDLA